MANTTMQLVNRVVVLLSEAIGVNFFSMDEALREAENIALLQEQEYNQLAGLVVRLSSIYTRNDIELVRTEAEEGGQRKEDLKVELSVLVNYMSTMLVPALSSHHNQMYTRAQATFKETIGVWTPEFTVLMGLILVFDYKHEQTEYRDLAYALAQTAVRIIHKHFEGVTPNAIG